MSEQQDEFPESVRMFIVNEAFIADYQSRQAMLRAALELVSDWCNLPYTVMTFNGDLLTAIGEHITYGLVSDGGSTAWHERAREFRERPDPTQPEGAEAEASEGINPDASEGVIPYDQEKE